jgi:hypothetical protein
MNDELMLDLLTTFGDETARQRDEAESGLGTTKQDACLFRDGAVFS